MFISMSRNAEAKENRGQGVRTMQGAEVKGRVWSKIIFCMACFCSEDSRGDDRRAKFSLVYEIRASEARR